MLSNCKKKVYAIWSVATQWEEVRNMHGQPSGNIKLPLSCVLFAATVVPRLAFMGIVIFVHLNRQIL